MSSSQHSHIGQASVPINTLKIGLGWKEWRSFITFKEKRVIHAEAQFDAESFKDGVPRYLPPRQLVLCLSHWIGWCGANSVISLATKIDKGPNYEAGKVYRNMTPSSSASTHRATTPLHTAEPQSSLPRFSQHRTKGQSKLRTG
ncbi:hypothetical protein HAX54_026647 [Datura stramonium]|uniref:Uncharacterized protein n=1 Tax=Datura stramonium TaxID=4076 RepID=A0ABS8V2W1_DATST|nr:hypothetical protein [Datura stramonium]